ncbi:hypothetical protein UFOVP116_182 [uncultured Caudovirales phage]|uniref:Uncharacterized protein n=1 Tax=uncultured Caudovirales phage TaxID=2100421 RepID=A0A6J5L749_9CAUD|nr:hypothetical protein UFOVP116_182 [uncultured Caudovirales phage]
MFNPVTSVVSFVISAYNRVVGNAKVVAGAVGLTGLIGENGKNTKPPVKK